MSEVFSPYLGGMSGALQAWPVTVLLGLREKDCFRENWGTHSATKKCNTQNPAELDSKLCFNKGAKTIQEGKDSVFNKWCWENWISSCKRANLDPDP